MNSVLKLVSSSVGRKFVMAITGLALVGFIITHLAGNLLLYKHDGTAFNAYAEKLASLGSLLYVLEIGLLALFVIHIITAIGLVRKNKSARPIGYKTLSSKDETHKSNIASRNMAITGLVLLVFLIIHIWHFKFGPGVEAGYIAQVNGNNVRDLHRWVYESFKSPMWVGFYVFVMLLLGAHLRHGFWSAFQSLGVMSPKLSKQIHCLGFFVAFILACGFLFIPIWIYFGLGGQ